LALKLGHYRIIEKIDAGGMGDVYLAQDAHLGRDDAINVLPSGTLIDGSARKHFYKEALALSKLNRPSIAILLDFVVLPPGPPISLGTATCRPIRPSALRTPPYGRR
jgi:serine/threonine protein kinase